MATKKETNKIVSSKKEIVIWHASSKCIEIVYILATGQFRTHLVFLNIHCTKNIGNMDEAVTFCKKQYITKKRQEKILKHVWKSWILQNVICYEMVLKYFDTKKNGFENSISAMEIKYLILYNHSRCVYNVNELKMVLKGRVC
jgi:hypothetical protein